MWIERADSEKIVRAAEIRPAVLLTGIRQAGFNGYSKMPVM